MSAGRVYLDHAATAPIRPEALAAMLCVYRSAWGNASSVHGVGRRARGLIERARGQVAGLLCADPARIVFTSGGTEANNLAVFGAAGVTPGRRHIVVSGIEHHSVLDACLALGRSGYEVTLLAPDGSGCVAAATVAEALRDDTALVALMLANNEVGTIQPVAVAARFAGARGIPLLCDAVAAAGKLALHVGELGADYVTISAHKVGGPQGVGALYLAPGRELAPLLHGGAQERAWRPGTENVAAIVGFGVAAELAARELKEEAAHLATLSAQLTAAVVAADCGAVVTGPVDPAARVPGLVSFAFPELDGDALLVQLDRQGIAAASGSACTSGSILPSHVLAAMGLAPSACRAALRLSLGKGTVSADVDFAARAVVGAVQQQRSLRPTAGAAVWKAAGLG